MIKCWVTSQDEDDDDNGQGTPCHYGREDHGNDGREDAQREERATVAAFLVRKDGVPFGVAEVQQLKRMFL